MSLGSETGSRIQVPQFLVILLFAREQSADALQSFHRLGTHAVLQVNLRLENEIFEHGWLRFLDAAFLDRGLCRRASHLLQAVGDGIKKLRVNLIAQHLQSRGMARFVGINFCSAVQWLARFPVLTLGKVKLEELDQGAAVFMFTGGGIE